MAVSCYIVYRITRVLDWMTGCLEPPAVSSENDSTSETESPQRSRPDPVTEQNSTPLSRELFAPSVAVSVSPSSMADPADTGAGPFRSQREREVLTESAMPPPSAVVTCIAHEVFPADGLSTPVCASKCFATETTLIMVLGGELIVSEGKLSMVPETGKESPLRIDHARAYDVRSRDGVCQANGCFRRGFSLSHGEAPIATCAVHLQDRLREPSQKAPTSTQCPSASLPTKSGHGERASVSRGNPKAYHFSDDDVETRKKKKTAEVVSPSPTSESWDSRGQEIQNLFGAR